ncbi:MAG TPA: hypothetical protein VH744_05455 [Terriglobales bacterium]|jgi:hypothetical protein
MTLMDAQHYDEARARRRKIIISSAVFLVLVLAWLVWAYRYWPEERIVDHFFAALQKQDFEGAYGVWMRDPQWKQHPQKYDRYPYHEFYTDWGPGGEWGIVKSHEIYASGTPKGGGSGVVVEVIVNGRAEHARVWVEKADKTLSFSPY